MQDLVRKKIHAAESGETSDDHIRELNGNDCLSQRALPHRGSSVALSVDQRSFATTGQQMEAGMFRCMPCQMPRLPVTCKLTNQRLLTMPRHEGGLFTESGSTMSRLS
jgi:hypothetical protein